MDRKLKIFLVFAHRLLISDIHTLNDRRYDKQNAGNTKNCLPNERKKPCVCYSMSLEQYLDELCQWTCYCSLTKQQSTRDGITSEKVKNMLMTVGKDDAYKIRLRESNRQLWEIACFFQWSLWKPTLNTPQPQYIAISDITRPGIWLPRVRLVS